MMKPLIIVASAGVLMAGAVLYWQSQQATPLAVGTEAPDFTLPSAGRDGVGKPVSLHSYRGKPIVLAFFYRARSAG
jgi:cytochrome oxidase Cu insertion factor (SCO1/SenC/PrrC family)